MRSFAANNPVEIGYLFDNRLIHGDNIFALNALEQDFAGKVKCIFIDSPYNTGSACASEKKLASQKQIKAIDFQSNDKRRSLFEALDAIDRQREELIGKIEGKLLQAANHALLFTLRWSLV